ncbi:4-hydroxy-tetrahydrodipicolinate reductase [Algoriphagus namhaensis]
MNIVLLGYGKMGKLIGQLAEERGHTLLAKISVDNVHELQEIAVSEADVAIDFSQPESAVSNIRWAIENGIPIVSGTTGWLDRWEEVTSLVEEKNGTFFYASNFSIGVNILFKANAYLAKLMNETSGYKATIEEIHHTAKLDAPSGTAITLAEGILDHSDGYKSWKLKQSDKLEKEVLPILARRIDPTPGTHTITYSSEIDDISLTHVAHSRQGFVMGAVMVAEWLKDKKGVLSMNDFLSF